MKLSTGEALRAAIRRSRWLIVASILAGLLAANVFAQLRGPRYEASAQVLIAAVDFGALLTGTSAPFQDAERTLQTEAALASSSGLYADAAEAAGGALGTGDEIDAAVSVDGSATSNILSFTARTGDPERAVALADLVASEFPAWRARLRVQDFQQAESQILQEIEAGGSTPQLQQQLSRLRLLRTVSAGNVTLADRPQSATQTAPSPVRDSLVGISIGLVVALLLVGAREAFDTTVRSDADVEDLLGVPVLAAVPLPSRRSRLVTLDPRADAQAATYAVLAAELERRRGGAGRVVLGLTSATAREGKSTTAANLAVELARRGNSVVMAEGDPLTPSALKLLPLRPGPATGDGVTMSRSTVLWDVALDLAEGDKGGTHGEVNGGRAVQASLATADPGSLRLLGQGASNGARPVRELLDQLAGLGDDVDWVVLNCPPALPTAGMAQLAPHLDMIVVVARQGRVSQRALRSLAGLARRWPTPPVGAVLTGTAGEGAYS